MKLLMCAMLAGLLTAGLGVGDAAAQTPGKARLEVRLSDYNGSSTKHYTVVWVTTASGTFVKSLRKQGPSSWTSKEWNDHCQAWNTARAGSTVLDGYTSATASNYSGTNSPVVCAWDGTDASGKLMADGNYKFWVQYAENSSQGPYTTSGLVWTKGGTQNTQTYPDQGANFSEMKVTWTPDAPATTPPTITSASLPATATVGVPYTWSLVAAGTAPIGFTANGLPPGLELSTAGALSGTPNTAGTFNGTITATNGTLPNASQAFSIVVSVIPVSISSLRLDGTSLVITGQGPATGSYAVLGSTEPVVPLEPTAVIATGAFDAQGRFAYTNAISLELPRRFFWLRVP